MFSIQIFLPWNGRSNTLTIFMKFGLWPYFVNVHKFAKIGRFWVQSFVPGDISWRTYVRTDESTYCIIQYTVQLRRNGLNAKIWYLQISTSQPMKILICTIWVRFDDAVLSYCCNLSTGAHDALKPSHSWCRPPGRRLFAERADAQQRRRDLLHPHQRSWTVDGRLAPRIPLQIAIRSQEAQGIHDAYPAFERVHRKSTIMMYAFVPTNSYDAWRQNKYAPRYFVRCTDKYSLSNMQ